VRKRSVAFSIVKSVAKYLLATSLGVIITLLFGPWFVALLPSPQVEATIQSLRGDSENILGCLYYVITIRTTQPIDYIYLKAQFPDKINEFKVGLPQDAQMERLGRIAMQAWEMGKDSNGNCTIVQAAITNISDVQTAAAGNMISIHASKLSSETTIVGTVATTEGTSTITPRPERIYTEAEYEYVKLGLTVRRPLHVSERVLPASRDGGGSLRPSSFSRWYHRSTAPQQNAPKRSEPLPLSALRFEAQTLSCGARPVHGRSCCASPKASPVEPEWFTKSALLSSAVHTLCAAESRRPLGLSTLHNPPEHLPPPDVHFLALR
jgi:hypothetical protein